MYRVCNGYWSGWNHYCPAWAGEFSQWRPDRACGTCGEREGSAYAKRCCTPDNMVEL